MIVPDSNVYGKYARMTAIADFVELLAVSSRPLSKADLADAIRDSNWPVEELIQTPTDATGEDEDIGQDEAVDAADRVFALLQERLDLLGNKYPFKIDRSRLLFAEAIALTTGYPYVAILAIAVAHSYRIPTGLYPERIFEDTVAEVMQSRALETANLGKIRRAAGTFEDAVMQGGTAIGLAPTPAAGVHNVYAHDEKADVLCHFTWGDTRAGTWCLIGQVTCGISESWRSKMAEPAPGAWSKFLNVQPDPLVFLAVPHHVEARQMQKLVQDSQGIVLDRIRLTQYKTDVSDAEDQLVWVVIQTPIEFGT